MTNKTSIVGTIGPSSEDPLILSRMIEEGLNLARINLSHGDLEGAKKKVDLIRSINDEIPIMLDLSGPKIRIHSLKESVFLKAGSELVLQKKEIIGNINRVSVNYPELIDLAEIGNRLFLNDGLIQVNVKEKKDNEILTEVVKPGSLSSNKGINCPDLPLTLFAPTGKDLRDIEGTIDLESEFYSLSFVRREEDIITIKEKINSLTNNKPLLISKIEHPDALNAYKEINKVSDVVMIARGDLGVEISPSRLPVVQKKLVRESNQYGVPTIVATQMLESMVFSPRATRAESSDVANAVLDGATGVMLSAETATGKYPVESVRTMSRIIYHSEKEVVPRILKNEHEISNINLYRIVFAAVQLAEELNVDAIIANTLTGRTAKSASIFKSNIPIIAISHDLVVCRQLNFYWGVFSINSARIYEDTDTMNRNSILLAVREGIINSDSTVIVIAGSILGKPYPTNLIQFYKVKDILSSKDKGKFQEE